MKIIYLFILLLHHLSLSSLRNQDSNESPTLSDPAVASIPTASPPAITMVTITFFGTATAGEIYSLVCTVIVSGSATPEPNITWMPQLVSQATVSNLNSAGNYSSTLTFNPLAASHAGTYTCQAVVNGMMRTSSKDVIVHSKLLLAIHSFPPRGVTLTP